MKVFSTRSCEHLIHGMSIDRGHALIKTFSDGEMFVRIEDDVAHKNVWLLAATPAPAENVLELFFMLDALSRVGAKVHLLMPYFGYARQDRAKPGESLSIEVLFNALQQFPLERVVVVHIHNPQVRRFFDFENVILLDFFLPLVEKIDCIVAPDEGARVWASAIGNHSGKEVIVMEKVRAEQEHVGTITFDGDVRDKNILIVDDMIATGGTMIHAARVLKNHGANMIYAAATHGIFSGNAYQMVQESPISKMWVTNSLVQNPQSPKIEVIDCVPMLETIIVSLL